MMNDLGGHHNMAELKELNDLYGINIPEDAKQVAEEAEKIKTSNKTLLIGICLIAFLI